MAIRITILGKYFLLFSIILNIKRNIRENFEVCLLNKNAFKVETVINQKITMIVLMIICISMHSLEVTKYSIINNDIKTGYILPEWEWKYFLSIKYSTVAE